MTDSEVIFRQVDGTYRIKAKSLRPFFYQYNELHNRMSGWNNTIQKIEGLINIAREYI